ncbi:hypothetical protein D3C76_1607230 [compost metagenome]
MVRAVYDQRFTPFARVTGCGSQFTEAVVHAVIHYPLLFCLKDNCGGIVLAGTRHRLLTCQNAFAHPVVSGTTDA